MRVLYDWDAVQQFYDAGHGRDECMAEFGFTIMSWYKAIRRGALRATLERQKTFDWDAVQRYHNEGHSFRECKQRFGFAGASWTKAVRRGALTPRPQALPLDVILANSRSRHTIKRRLIGAGILKNVCDECGLSEWRGKHLSIQLDHRNGIRDDHRPENLRMLCPNCHSQTETFGARNKKRLAEHHSRVV